VVVETALIGAGAGLADVVTGAFFQHIPNNRRTRAIQLGVTIGALQEQSSPWRSGEDTFHGT
jgi:hypothetical protein